MVLLTLYFVACTFLHGQGTVSFDQLSDDVKKELLDELAESKKSLSLLARLIGSSQRELLAVLAKHGVEGVRARALLYGIKQINTEAPDLVGRLNPFAMELPYIRVSGRTFKPVLLELFDEAQYTGNAKASDILINAIALDDAIKLRRVIEITESGLPVDSEARTKIQALFSKSFAHVGRIIHTADGNTVRRYFEYLGDRVALDQAAHIVINDRETGSYSSYLNENSSVFYSTEPATRLDTLRKMAAILEYGGRFEDANTARAMVFYLSPRTGPLGAKYLKMEYPDLCDRDIALLARSFQSALNAMGAL